MDILDYHISGRRRRETLTKGNINSILNQTVYIAIMAFGAIFVYSHGGMDLSYGGVIGFSVLVAILVANTGVPAGVVFITNILAALVWFVLNGVVSVYLQVSPFITSLCIMYMCRGILNTVCASQKYSIPVELFEFDNQKFKLGMLLGVFIICYILFEKTAIGKDNKAIGGNPAAAKQAGVNVNRTRMIAYIISGITVGIAGFILMARAGSVSTSTGQGMEMNVVTALVLGGVPLSGGSKVKMIGAVVGSFSVILLRNGLIILGVNERVVEGIQGLVLLLLVFLTYVNEQRWCTGVIDETRRKRGGKEMKRIKRAVAVLLAVMMVFSVIGCGGSSGSKKSDSSSKETKDAKTEEVWGDKSGQDEICGDPDGKYTIGVVIHTTTDFLCAKYKAYTDYLGKAYGVNLTITLLKTLQMKHIFLQLKTSVHRVLMVLSQQTSQEQQSFRD